MTEPRRIVLNPGRQDRPASPEGRMNRARLLYALGDTAGALREANAAGRPLLIVTKGEAPPPACCEACARTPLDARRRHAAAKRLHQRAEAEAAIRASAARETAAVRQRLAAQRQPVQRRRPSPWDRLTDAQLGRLARRTWLRAADEWGDSHS